MGGLVGYGGDPRVVASREEIERVSAELAVVAQELNGGALMFLPDPIQRAQLDVLLPHIDYRITRTRQALAHAAESYFSTDARVAHHIESIGAAVRHHPWLWHLLPKTTRDGIVAGGVLALVAAQFAPGNTGAMATRLAASSIDERQIAKALDNHSAVKFRSVPSSDYPPPTSLAEISARLELVNRAESQVRIETYTSGGSKTMLVYLPGTQSLNPLAGSNPFDVNTDAELARSPATAPIVSAVEQALRASGAEHANVVLVGYSLGGLVAGELAASHKFNVTGVLTIGSPLGQQNIPADIPVLSIQHSNDPVPAATGHSNPLTDNWATASKRFELSAGEASVAAHELNSYQSTVVEVDSTRLTGVSRIRSAILKQLVGAPTSVTYEFSRGA